MIQKLAGIDLKHSGMLFLGAAGSPQQIRASHVAGQCGDANLMCVFTRTCNQSMQPSYSCCMFDPASCAACLPSQLDQPASAACLITSHVLLAWPTSLTYVLNPWCCSAVSSDIPICGVSQSAMLPVPACQLSMCRYRQSVPPSIGCLRDQLFCAAVQSWVAYRVVRSMRKGRAAHQCPCPQASHVR